MASDWKAFENLTPQAFSDELSCVTANMEVMLAKKRQSYGPSNLSEFGDVGVLIRTNDKIKRLIHMWQQGMTETPVGEDDEDAWADIVGYGLLVLVARRLGKHRTVEHAGPLTEPESERTVRG